MATHSVNLLLLFLLSSFISILTPMAARANDEAALLAFKAAAIRGGYGDPLASWNGSANGYCSWEGVRCRGWNQQVVALNLPSRGLTGVLSPAIGNLTSLRILNLTKNEFSGDIPPSLGRLHHLRVLDLSRNTFSGEIPLNLTSCMNLKIMALEHNQLCGRVPSEIGDNLIALGTLLLEYNNLTGAIPSSLGNLSSLVDLELTHNQLEGTIPPSLGNIRGIHFLSLADNNLSGELPLSLYNLSSVHILQLHINMLHGKIPVDIGSRFPSLLDLSLAQNQFTGSIPNSVSNLTTLRYLQLQTNKFSGYVPPTIGRLSALLHLSLYENTLEANDSEGWNFITSLSNCSQLHRLLLFSNTAFTGQLPSSIVNLSTTLQILRFDGTRISGRIPSSISNLVNIQSLGFHNTSISGVIPESIGKLGKMNWLTLFNTDLSGQIPSSVGNLTSLTWLFVNDANLEGPIPASIGNIKSMLRLDLSRNRLNGSIPADIFKLLTVASYIDLSYNLLSGPLPFEVGSLRNLNFLDLSGNQLSGVIPDGIGELVVLQELWLDNNSFEGSIPGSLSYIKGLIALSLSMNKLSGSIPNGIGSIKNLQQLYLDHNNLSGQIPAVLENLTSLSKLDLSFNNLQGEVPREGIFRNFANLSIDRNNKLCGGMPQLHLPPCQINYVNINRKRNFKPLKIALETIAALLFLAFIIGLTQLIYKKLMSRKSRIPPLVEEQYGRVSYHALAYGTNGFSEANLLGKGSFGAVYKCTFQDEGTIAAVKVFNLEQSGSTRSFAAECDALRRVRHRCLLKIITCCSSINHLGQEFKALVFEFMPNGSLHGWLHPQSSTPTVVNTLSIAQRLNIAVDIMDALDYLHNHCQPPIVHCDVKPSNILLAQDMGARVADFGISRILPEKASQALQNSNSTIGIRGSIGYVAPEYGEGSPISALGDIYGLGILLLEMFTGKSPTNDMFRGSLDLHKFSRDALPDRIWDIADTTMWLHTIVYDSFTRSKI